MADVPEKTDDSAEKAYAAATSSVKAEQAKAQKPVEAPKAAAPAPVAAPAEPAIVEVAKAEPAKPAPAIAAAPKPVTPKVSAKATTKAAPKKAAPKKATVTKKAPARKIAAAKPAPKKTAASKAAAPKKKTAVWKQAAVQTSNTPTVTELKEMIMATKTKDFTETMSKTVTEAVADIQSKAQAAYDKSTASMTEATELAKGNVEAIVESGKILAAAAQDFGATYADEAKAAYETLTADMKEMAAVKSPTELFQLQGKIMRRNFDAFVASASKGTESAMKLANDVAAPVAARVNVAVEKLSKVA